MKSAWTTRQVRHRNPRWYWIRFGEDDDAEPAQMHTQYGDSEVYFRGRWMDWDALVAQGAERSVENLAPPKEAAKR